MDQEDDVFSLVWDDWERMIGVLVRYMYTTHCAVVCIHSYVVCVYV